MKKYLSLLSASTLVFILAFAPVKAAQDSKLTDEEKALWEEVFGKTARHEQSNPKSVKQSTQNTANISGSWVGYYEYDKPRGQPASMFNVVIKDLGEKFLMTFLEPRDDAEEYIQWGVNTTAKRQGKYIEFVKGYSHNDTPIIYNLTISHNGTIMDGTWKVSDNFYGRAFFYKVHLKNLKNIRQGTIE
ncbi:hypothetical protein DZA50_04850 [Kangiella sp. HD9-110m-PIT-SAG07]|nr:hypothetical protein DZA50_04850 [Kangiella sp. HD9-110m-PIT-SAG07]